MGSLANAYGADKTSVLNGWVHPAERPAQPPRTEVLYGREWSAADAAYARELMENEGLTAADLARLWATERPSVRATLSTSEPLSTSPQVDSPSLAPVEVNAFERWLVGSGLTLRQVADRFGVSRQAVHKWKAKGAPPEVMSKLEG